jgi:anti-anti-sigma factor
MPAQFERNDGRTIIRVSGEMTIFAANEIKNLFHDALQKAGKDPVEIDLSAVDEMDASGLQIVLAAAKQVKQREGILMVTGRSAPAKKIFELVNASDYVKCE